MPRVSIDGDDVCVCGRRDGPTNPKLAFLEEDMETPTTTRRVTRIKLVVLMVQQKKGDELLKGENA